MVFLKHNSRKSISFNPIFILCFSGSIFFMVQVFQSPDFSASRFFRVQVFQGPCPGFRSSLQKNLGKGQFFQKMCLKGISFCSFHGLRNFNEERFLSGENLANANTKMAEKINIKPCTLIFDRLLHKKSPAFFLKMSNLSFQYLNEF